MLWYYHYHLAKLSTGRTIRLHQSLWHATCVSNFTKTNRSSHACMYGTCPAPTQYTLHLLDSRKLRSRLVIGCLGVSSLPGQPVRALSLDVTILQCISGARILRSGPPRGCPPTTGMQKLHWQRPGPGHAGAVAMHHGSSTPQTRPSKSETVDRCTLVPSCHRP